MVGEILEAMLKQLEGYRGEFYKQLIPLHENPGLRALAGKDCFSIYKPQWNSEISLWFNTSGFAVGIPVYHSGSDWDLSGYYTTNVRPFTKENGVLVVRRKAKAKKEELLELFPKLTVEGIEAVLEKEVKKLDIFNTLGSERS